MQVVAWLFLVHTRDADETGEKNDMLEIARVLGELAREYVQAAEQPGRDCRLVVPGLTEKIAQEIHEYLYTHGINSYFIVGPNYSTNENKRWIRPVGLTSKRIGSFVAIVAPGQLAHIQDSIRGAGGAIRSIAFSEEWPWIDNGSEAFRFDGPVLDRLVEGWTNREEYRQWLREFILEGLVKDTRTSSWRAQLLLEDILGTFKPSSYSSLEDIRAKFLFHVGIPLPSQGITDVPTLITSSTRLCRQITERCQKEDDIREYTRDVMIPGVIEDETEQHRVRESIDVLLDGLGVSRTYNLGLLAFHSCWGNTFGDTTHWLRLHSDLLAELFDVKELPRAEITCQLACERGIISNNRKTAASFFGEDLHFIVNYNIPPDQFSQGDWEVVLTTRKQRLVSKPVQSAHGELELLLDTSTITGRYSSRIPLRLNLFCKTDTCADIKLALHLCGDQRPAFVVVKPGFDVTDAYPMDNEDVPDKKLETSEPVYLYLFHDLNSPPEVYDENEKPVGIGIEEPGIWRTTELIDPTIEGSGQSTRICIFGDKSVVLCLEAEDVVKGEFTIEDELRVKLSGSKDGRIKELASLFSGEKREPYPHLGKLNDASRRRISLASLVTNRLGWKPLLTDLLNPNHGNSGAIGDFINYLGNVDGEGFNGLSFPGEALELLRAYSEARGAACERIESSLTTRPYQVQHPIYASHPVFVANNAREIEELLVAYLESYLAILDYLENVYHELEWAQLFVLTYLDCVVHWDNGSLRNALLLVGPCHPMVLAKRFLVQASLYSRTQRFISGEGGKDFRQLVALLERVHGFRWLPGVSAEDRFLEPVYVSATSDPGWHVAVKTNIQALAQSEMVNLPTILDRLRMNFGLDSDIVSAGADYLVSSCLSSYMRAFPSRRAVGIRVCQGYCNSKIIKSIDEFLHSEESPTDHGRQLPGGVRLYLQAPLGDVEDVTWFNPPISVYEYQDDANCFAEENPDIYMLPPGQSLLFRPYAEQKEHYLPRASSWEAVFFEPLNLLTEGQSLIPKSVTYEYQVEPINLEICNLGGLFVAAASKACFLLKDPIAIVRSVKLPHRLDCPWAIIPGKGLDPAILVKYVRDGMSRLLRERALWDYMVDLAGQNNSYYILSNIPRSFQVSVNGVFDRDDVASGFICELGRIGIAIGGEALKSGKHALGVIGLVGAVRLFLGLGGNGHAPLYCGEGRVGFLIPVDSFASFFGHSSAQQDKEAKRTDLLAIQLVLPESPDGKMRIYACGVESKFVSGTFNLSMSRNALAQARSTLSDFRMLVQNGLGDGSIPERLGLVALLRFGLRISSPSSPREISAWVNIERRVYEAILQKRYEYKNAKHEAVLVTTEMGLPGTTEMNELPDGLWIRLNKENWPGVSDTNRLNEIRQELSGLFKEDTLVFDERTTPVEREIDLRRMSSQENTQAITSEDSETTSGREITCKMSTTKVAAHENVIGTEDWNDHTADPGVPLRKILIGVDNGRRAIYYDSQSLVDPLDNLNIMVTGSSGTGKTQFLKYLICQLRQQEKNTLILDFKNDFASDRVFTERAQLSRVFVNFDGLPFNPLIPYPVKHPATGELFIQCGQHIAGVAAVLKKTYGLGPQQQAAVKNAIVDSFTAANIPTAGSKRFDDTMQFPDFSNVGNALQVDNIAAYNRLDPLFTLGLFKEDFRDISFHSLVGRSVVVDLSQIPSDGIKNALAQLIVMCAHAYYNSQPHSGNVRQVLVFDEAHRVLNSDYILRLVRECRAYGVGTILSSQYPSDFPLDISASMATKIIHGNGRDIERVKDIVKILGCEGQEADVSNLDRFQAYVDNRHYPHTMIRTMNYPLFLVWSFLQEKRMATRAEISQIDGLDLSKLPIENLVRQIERLGLAVERDRQVHLLGQND
jgi:hypothetical protein